MPLAAKFPSCRISCDTGSRKAMPKAKGRARSRLDLRANGVVAWFFFFGMRMREGARGAGCSEGKQRGRHSRRAPPSPTTCAPKVKAKQEASLVFKTKKITRMIK